MYYASTCAIAKDENASLKEWLLYHLAIGFEHVYIYDNNSARPIKETLKEYVDAGLVTVFDLALKEKQQMSAYMHCLKTFRNATFWLAFIDIDEFVTPIKSVDIKNFLDDYREFGGLGLHWNIFGSNGHISRPDGHIIENYTQCLGLDKHIKSIVQPKLATHPLSPHHFAFKDNYYCVNEDKFAINTPFSYPVGRKIKLNHYYYKSQQDYEEKIARGLVSQVKNVSSYNISHFYDHLSKFSYEDRDILKFIENLKDFERSSPASLSKIVQRYISKDLIESISLVYLLLNNREVGYAFQLMNTINRYHDSFELHLIEALVYFATKRDEKALKILSKLLLESGSDPDKISLIYEQLESYYKKRNRPDAIEAIRKFIE